MNMDKYELFSKVFKQHIEHRLNTSKVKISDLPLEELMTFAMEDCNIDFIYESGNHGKGRDIVSSTLGNPSVKSAQIKPTKNTLTISSFRLSRFAGNIDQMVEFIDNEGKNFKKYFILARNQTTKTIDYVFYILPSNIFEASNMEWAKYGKDDKNWKTVNDSDVSLKIVKDMSSQLWIELNLDYIEQYAQWRLTREVETLGKDRFKVNID